MNAPRLALLAVALLPAALFGPSCSSTQTGTPAAAEVTLDADGEPEGLHHHRRWSDRLGQGAQPQGDVAFANLAALGYTTVLSVDGAAPDLEAAHKYGLRYVHVPIGYDGIPKEAAATIVRAVELSDGPVYVHCHHGRHRGPAGAMVARIAIDGISTEQAVEELRISKCSPKYEGLYRDIGSFVPPTAEDLAAVGDDLPEVVKPDGLVDAMVKVSHTWENVKLVKAADWAVPPSNPDVAPAHEATMLWEHLRETARLEESKGYGDRFLELLTESEGAADRLQAALRSQDDDGAAKAYDVLAKGCNSCHTLFRN